MRVVQDIIRAARKKGIDPYSQPFSPNDLGLRGRDYGSFSDYCSDTVSSKWNHHVVLKVAEWRKNKPLKYLLLQQKEHRISANLAESSNDSTGIRSTEVNSTPSSEYRQKMTNKYFVSTPSIESRQKRGLSSHVRPSVYADSAESKETGRQGEEWVLSLEKTAPRCLVWVNDRG